MNQIYGNEQIVGGIRFLPSADSLGRTTPLPLQARFNVFGVPLLVAANAPYLQQLAEESFAHWGRAELSAGNAPLRLHLCVQDAPALPSDEILRPLMRSQEQCFLVAAGPNLGFADRATGFGAAFITPALLAHPDKVRSWFIECLGIYLACGKRNATLHAAGIVWNGRTILLTGTDGAGKSTLAYACVRAGAQLLAEDMVCIEEIKETEETKEIKEIKETEEVSHFPQNNCSGIMSPRHSAAGCTAKEFIPLWLAAGSIAKEPVPLSFCRGAIRGWGDSRYLHLLPDAIRFFPELRDIQDVEQFNGEAKRRIHIADLRPGAGTSQGDIWGVCSLQQSGKSGSCLVEADPAHLRQVLTRFKGDPPVDQPAMQAAVDRLLRTNTAHLEMGTDLDFAVETLRNWHCGAQGL